MDVTVSHLFSVHLSLLVNQNEKSLEKKITKEKCPDLQFLKIKTYNLNFKYFINLDAYFLFISK